jgi:hypothetical protein
MRTKIFIFICGISLVLLFGVAFCRSGYINLLNLVGFPLSSLVGFLLYGFLTVICLYKFRVKLPPKYILLAIWMGVGLLETIYRCYSFKSSTQFPQPPSQNNIMLLVLWGHEAHKVLSNA